MTRIIFLLISLLNLSFLNIYAQKMELCSKRNANIFLLGDKKTKQIQCNLKQTFDPYNGGITTPVDEKQPEYFVFHKNGKMEYFANNVQEKGAWKVSKEKDQIFLHYSMEKIETFKIAELTREKMILAIQGRHGMVERTFIIQKNNDK